jgi:hypothetical protein
MEGDLSSITNAAINEKNAKATVCAKGNIQGLAFGKRHRLTAADGKESVPKAKTEITAWPQISLLMINMERNWRY